jgi:branched-chain amino acid transport system ATP-binding protein
VLADVGFTVGAGEIVGLIGPNGAGKTTLFNLVSGLLRPERGSIRLDGREITGLPAWRVCRLGVGRTFQTPRPFEDLTALDNVRTAALFARRPGPPPPALLERVGLAGLAGEPAGRLPSARRKLLELAMALASSPRLLLLDEVLAGSTPAEVSRTVAVLRALRDEHGLAIFWIEHLMRAVMQTADRVIVLHHGEVIAQGDPASVARDPRVLAAYLGRVTDSEPTRRRR